MSSIEYGIRRAYNEIVGGIVISTFINSLKALQIPGLEAYLFWIRTISFVGTLSLVVSTTRWTIGYLIGWAIGICFLSYADLVDIWDFIIYLIIPIALRILICYYKEKEKVWL